jgi:thiol-disulfide isomerase/thioredoxin
MPTRGRVLGIVCLLSACGAKAPRDDGQPRHADVPVASAREPEASRPVVSGRLRAHDGGALRASHYSVQRYGSTKAVSQGSLTPEGTFEVEVDPGLYVVSFSAVDHAQTFRVVLVETDLRVAGNLGTYKRAEPGTTISIVGAFLDTASKPVGSLPTTATRTDDGRHRVELGEPPKTAVRIRYQLQIDDSRTANAPGAPSYEYDGGGDFWSIAEIPTDRTLLLDMRELPPAGQRASLEWEGESATTLAVRDHVARWDVEVDRLVATMPVKDGRIHVATKEFLAAMAALVKSTRAEIEAESDEQSKTLLRALHFLTFAQRIEPKARGEEFRWFFDHVPVDDPRLALAGGMGINTFFLVDDADRELSAAAEAWLDRFAKEQPEPGLAIDALNILLHRADSRGDTTRVKELYERAGEPRYRDMFQRELIARAYDPARVMQRGKPLPDFDFVALGSPSKRVTKAERAGRLYLVEFWATWCGPCIADMPLLHETYAAVNAAKKGKGKGMKALQQLRPVAEPDVEFLFISFDATAKDVEKFRRDSWSMPWTHAFVGQAEQTAVMKQFGFSGVPTAVLVDSSGTIIEYGESLRGRKLRATLEKALGRAAIASR